MKITMSAAASPRLVAVLGNLSTIIDKAEAHAAQRKIDPHTLVSARLFPDMHPFSRQVQIACDTAKGAVARLAGVDVPKHEDNEKTFGDLKERIAKTIAFIKSVDPASIDGSEDREIVLKLGPNEVRFTGMQYLLGFVLPNFYFHVATAYGILRHNGVELGKRDFIGTP